MKTTTLDVGGMLSTLDYQAVEKRLARTPGVEHASASSASNSATIEYDETVTSVAALGAAIRDCGFHCAGKIMPKHVCKPHLAAAAGRQAPMPPEPMGVAAARPAGPAPHTHEQAGEPPSDMGHGDHMHMHAMVRDMRNRFWISLVFSVPILLYWAEHDESLGAIVTHVLVHEIGHHFGLSDADMEAIEASVV